MAQSKVILYAGAILLIFMLSAALINAQPDIECKSDDCEKESATATVSTAAPTPAPTTSKTNVTQTTSKPETTKKIIRKIGDCFVKIIPDDGESSEEKDKKDEKNKLCGKNNKEDNESDEDNDLTTQLRSLYIWLARGYGWPGSFNQKRQGKKNAKKGRYIRVRCPVVRYPDFRKFPVQRFPSLVAISPWLPIYYDTTTYQTIIFSQSAGLYVLPPVMNFYGQRFAVAQLLQWGYASLNNNGASLSPSVDVSGFVQPAPPAVNTNVMGTNPAPGLVYDERQARFNGEIKSNFVYVKPQYEKVIYERKKN